MCAWKQSTFYGESEEGSVGHDASQLTSGPTSKDNENCSKDFCSNNFRFMA
jgi:hypothetical protein